MAAPDHHEILGQRLRVTLTGFLAIAIGSTLLDALSQPQARDALLALKAGQILLLGAALWAVRSMRTPARLLAAGTGTMALLFASSAVAAVLRGDGQVAALVVIAANVATAALIPWGGRAQLAVALASGLGAAAALVTLGRPFPADPYGIAGVVGALAGTVVVARQQELGRRARKAVATLFAGHTRILEMIATGTPLEVVLDALCRMIESQAPGLLCSVLLRRDDRLHAGAAPSLPPTWTAAIDGIAIGPEAGSCGSAAFHRVPVVVHDVCTDPRWVRYRDLAAAHALRACWSVPIVAADGTCHGTFAMYYREPRTPGRAEWRLLESAARLAGVALERGRAAAALETSQRELLDESQVSRALAGVGEAMIATIDEPLVLERLCRFAAELLAADAASVVLLDADGETFRIPSTHGHRPEHEAALRGFTMPASLLAPLVETLRTTAAVEVPAGQLRSEQARRIYGWLGVARVLSVPLWRGPAIAGFLCAARRTDRAFTAVESRIASGLVHLGALALENARLVDELRTATRLKSEFVSTMSHELRTPLSVIIGYTEMLRDTDVAPEERAALLERVRRQSLELLELIEATLDLGRLEAGRDRPQLEPIDVVALFAELEVDFATMRRPPGPELVWEAAAGASLVTDPRKLRTVLKNLVGNALKFTPSGSIVVSSRETPAAAVLTVRDTGIGIPEAQLPVIWDMFRQVDGSDARSYAGVGLGLYIVRRLVGQLGGTVTVASVVGQGTTFTVTLRREQAPLRAVG
ncbi:MAG: GAF domain-containing sensor histidine kinase [bacterium]|nr:GAF domain-containing sensor histidine kinase [bacterium]